MERDRTSRTRYARSVGATASMLVGLLCAACAASFERAPEPDDPDPILCGGADRSPCAAYKYCAFPDGCGTVGRCSPRNAGCGAPRPACGCDGKTYPSECAAGIEGMGLAHLGPCGTAAEQFACGDFRCDGARYCLDVTADSSEPDQQNFACLALPDGCTTCACSDALASTCLVGARCAEAAGHVAITCE